MTTRILKSAFLSPAVLGLAAALAIVAGIEVRSRVSAAPQSYEGELEVSHGDDFTHGHATFNYGLKTAAGRFELKFQEHDPVLPRAKKVKVQGQKVGTTINVVSGKNVQAADGSTGGSISGPVAYVTGPKRVAVVLLKFSAAQANPYPKSTAEGIAFNNSNSVAAYYSEVSNGQLTLTGTVFDWVVISGDTSACNYSAWSNAADQVLGSALTGYDYRVYAFPQVAACGWAGLAYLPGTLSYLNGSGGMSLRVMSHELGHNLGTHHASTLRCVEGGVRVAFSATASNCTPNEYGDPFTVMGASSSRHPSNFSRGNMGWLSTGNTQDVTATGTYTLAAAEDPSTAVKALRISRPSGDYVVLELRRPYGQYFDAFAPTDPAVTGVSVRIAPGYSSLVQSKLVDATPATDSFADAALPIGSAVREPTRGVTITTLSVANGVATVQVSFDPDSSPPSVPGSFTATPQSATSIRLSWAASTDNSGVSGYEVRRNGVLVTTTTATTFTDTGLVGGTTYAYAVRAKDAAGNASADATTSATTPIPDTQAPTAPPNLAGTATTKPTRVSLTWGPSTDNVAVTGYRVYRGSTLVATLAGTARSYSDRPGRGTFTYTVVAVDAAGNTSPASNAVTVTVR